MLSSRNPNALVKVDRERSRHSERPDIRTLCSPNIHRVPIPAPRIPAASGGCPAPRGTAVSDGVSGAGDSDAGERCESIRVVSCESRTIHPAVLFGVARSAILLPTLIRSAYICGHRQVVRHQLPKLTLAGSSPVARSRNFKAPATVPFPFPGPSRGLEPDGVARLRESARVPQRAREGAAGPRSMRAPQARASPVARSRNFKAPALAMFAPIPFVFRNLARNRCLGEGHLEPSPKNKYRFVRNERLVRFKSNEKGLDRMHRRRPGT